MKIGLVSYRCENKDISFNVSQIERAMEEAGGKVDLLCFGEAFLQGFDSLCWEYESDRQMAVGLHSETIRRLRGLTVQYGTALLTGYIEKEQDRLYSSCVVLADGGIIRNYRRISKGWKAYWKTDGHYCEGTETRAFQLCGKEMMLALCGSTRSASNRTACSSGLSMSISHRKSGKTENWTAMQRRRRWQRMTRL